MPRKVLYVEDDPDAVVFLKRVVGKLGGYELQTYESGDSLVGDLNKQANPDFVPEIILLDINLPGMNGFELLEHLRAQKMYKRVPVIMFTSSGEAEDVEKSYRSGANAYLVKPDDLKKLHVVLEDTFNFWFRHNLS